MIQFQELELQATRLSELETERTLISILELMYMCQEMLHQLQNIWKSIENLMLTSQEKSKSIGVRLTIQENSHKHIHMEKRLTSQTT